MLNNREQSKVLLDLAKATIDRTFVPPADLLAQALPLAKENGMYFYVLSLLSEVGAKDAVDIEEEYMKLCDRQQYVEKETGRLSQSFAARDLPVFFIKDFMRYPFTDHDVDFVAVRRPLMPAYRKSMKELGYRYRFGKSQIREPDKYFYYPLHTENRYGDIRFHLHKALSWNGVIFLNSEDVLARCREEARAARVFWVPGYEDEILIMAAHALFENASIGIGEILQFGLLVRDEEINWEYLVQTASRYNWQAGLALFLDAVWSVLASVCHVRHIASMHEWAVRTLSKVGIVDVFRSRDLVFPHQIPYGVCMRLYMDKMARDLRGTCLSTRGFVWEGLSFLVFVWLTRLKKRVI